MASDALRACGVVIVAASLSTLAGEGGPLARHATLQAMSFSDTSKVCGGTCYYTILRNCPTGSVPDCISATPINGSCGNASYPNNSKYEFANPQNDGAQSQVPDGFIYCADYYKCIVETIGTRQFCSQGAYIGGSLRQDETVANGPACQVE